MARRPKPDSPTLFDLRPAEIASALAARAQPDRPYSDPQLFLGTSAFTASGWPGTFYPADMKPAEYLGHYAKTFRTVEIDSTFYGTPTLSTVNNWYNRTPADFIFSAKVPQEITHKKRLLNCEPEFREFLDTMSVLEEKLGPLLFQFPHFDQYEFKNAADFLARLRRLLEKFPQSAAHKFVVEIRNPSWVDERFLTALREHRVALALTDSSFVPRPWEYKKPLDWITSDFAYVRWLGHRKQIETVTTTWDKTVVDRTSDLKNWVELFREFVSRNLKVFAYANNHYAGSGPATISRFWQMLKDEKP